MAEQSPPVLLEIENHIATLTLNRVSALNALDEAMAQSLYEHSSELMHNHSVRCVVIRGAGGHFMAGGDVGVFYQSLSLPHQQLERQMDEIFTAVNGLIINLRSMPQPVIASVEGSVAGFGISLLCACDLAIAANDAQFNLAYRHIGATPDGGASWFLPRLVGLKNSMELVLLGEQLGADQAQSIGLINRLVEAKALSDATTQMAQALVLGPAKTLANSKRLINQAMEHTMLEQLQKEKAAFIESMKGAEFNEGVTAFCEKRQADFLNKR